jgi:hypothetical protein
MENNDIMEYYEKLSLNRRIGEPYKIKFKNDDTVYIGIPVLEGTDDTKFSFKVSEPEDKRGMRKDNLKDIESMEKVL